MQRLAAQALKKQPSLGALGRPLPEAQPGGESRGSLQDAQDAPVAMERVHVEHVEQVEEQGRGASLARKYDAI